jgi:hypothetical protein
MGENSGSCIEISTQQINILAGLNMGIKSLQVKVFAKHITKVKLRNHSYMHSITEVNQTIYF